MPEFGIPGFRFQDAAARPIEEEDVPAVIELFKLNYGDNYSIPEFYDQRWVKRGIYSDHIIWVVLEEEGEVVASGACILDYGDNNDQIGEIGRLVVHPERRGRGLGRRLIGALLDAADDTVEFSFGEARTVHPMSQGLFEKAGFAPLGFLPQMYAAAAGEGRESYVAYGKLYGNGQALRRESPPELIPEIAPLARYVLSAMGLPTTVRVVDSARPYPAEASCVMEPLDRRSLARLVRIEQGRVVEPLLFGGLSLDQGISHIRRRQAVYHMALSPERVPLGAIGHQADEPSKLLKGIELVAVDEALRGYLASSLLRRAEETGAQVIEVNVSAYDARLQRTFAEHGFRPLAYAPAMIFHGTERLDVVKMAKFSFAYDPGSMTLTDTAKETVSLVEKAFR